MKTILLLIGVSLFSAFSFQKKHYQIFVESKDYPIEDYWKISEVEFEGESAEVFDHKAISSRIDKIKVSKEGEYEFIFTSIFADTIIKVAKVVENKPSVKIVFPELEGKVSNYSGQKSFLFREAKEIKMTKIAWGCFGVNKTNYTITKIENGGVFQVKSDWGENNKYDVSSMQFNGFINSLKFKKKDKPRWGSTNRDYWYFKVKDQIIILKEKDFNMEALNLEIGEMEK